MSAPPLPSLVCGVIPLKLDRDGAPVRAMLAYAFGSGSAQEESLRAVLSPEEHGVAARYSHPRRLLSYLLGRHCAKRALAPLLGEADLRTITITSGVFDQPLVRYPSAERFDVSLTHWDGGAVAVAFPDGHPMGIDGEALDASRVETMTAQLTTDEKAWSADSPLLRPTVAWTAREALSKALRCGLMVPLEFLSISTPLHEGPITEGRYTHFTQYRFLCLTGEHAVITLCLPRNTRLLNAQAFLPLMR